jgi:hypothetical protein
VAYSVEPRVCFCEEFRMKAEYRKAPSRYAINRLVNKSETAGSIIDNKNGVFCKYTYV